jgi:hypothetical protein
MPKLKLVGSKDGGFCCDGCWYYSIVNSTKRKRACVRPNSEVPCVIGKAGAPRFAIFVEDKDA